MDKRSSHSVLFMTGRLFLGGLLAAVLAGTVPLLLAGCGRGPSSGQSAVKPAPPPPTPPPPVVTIEPPRIESAPAAARETQGQVVVVDIPANSEYQAVISPTLNGRRTHLKSDVPAVARFWIGPPTADNAAPPEERRVNPDILRAVEPIPLMVSMACNVCTDPPPPGQTITYHPSEKRSTEAHFEFTPRVIREQDDPSSSDLVFLISVDATEYDRVAVPVLVDPAPTAPDAVASHRSSGLGDAPSPADVLIKVEAGGGGTLRLSITPFSDALKAEIGSVIGFAPKTLTFATNLDAASIDTHTSSGFYSLKQRMESWNPLGTTHPANPDDDSFLGDYSTSGLQQEDQDKLLESLASVGNDLYRDLFYVQRSPLQQVIETIEAFKTPTGRPLRVTIETDLVYIPWPLLRAPTTTDIEAFWGYRFELTVLPWSVWIPPSLPTLTIDGPAALPFAIYVDDSAYQGVGWFARKGAERTAALMKTVKPHLLESSTDASEFLVKNRSKIKLFMTYMHATSFIQLREVDNQLVRAEIDGGPRLFFSEYDALTSAELRRLPNKLRLGNETMFTEQPLVILNACETGVAPYSPLANVHYTDSLPIVMIKLGARAVVATDAPVFKLAAAHFGEMLSKHLLRGVRGPQAVWLARKELLAKGNAVGLLYSFYGDPQVRVRIGP